MFPQRIRSGASFEFSYRLVGPIDPVFHSHPYYELYYFHEGVCNYLIGDKIYVLSPGDLILMNGMTLHCAKIDKSVPYVRTLLHFQPENLRPLLDMPHALNVFKPFQELGNHRLSLAGPEREEAERLLARMDGYKRRGDTIGYNRLQLALADMLYYVYDLCQQPLRDKPEFPSDKERTVQDIISFIESQYTRDLTLDMLQDHLHLSKYHLSKLFKEVTGVTIFDYVYRRRINQAKIMFLLNPRTSVTEVCFQLGFKHLAHFSRLFKKQTGQSPESFKKRLAEEKPQT